MLLRVGDVPRRSRRGSRARLGPLFFIALALVHLLINVAPKMDTSPLLLGHLSRPHEQHGWGHSPRARCRPAARFAQNCPQKRAGQSFLC